ncbi:MAG: hypothetical protein FDW93_03505 [Bergeyella sp.]|nr:hypothetical protein [Bergeyella sp.]
MIASGREISLPLAGLNAPDVLLVGGIFGVMGYIIVEFTKRIPVLGSNTDNIALTVLILGILVRVIFGVKNKKVFNTDFRVDKKTGRCWLPFQSTIPQVFIISLSSAILAASMAVAIHFNLGTNEGDIEGSSWSILLYNVHILPFAISALCIFFVAMGYKFPVTHHVTITSALAAWMFYPIVGHHIYFAVFLGTVMGVFSGLMCEFFARLFYIDGDTHIDPPASIIWISTTITLMSVKLIEGVAL